MANMEGFLAELSEKMDEQGLAGDGSAGGESATEEPEPTFDIDDESHDDEADDTSVSDEADGEVVEPETETKSVQADNVDAGGEVDELPSDINSLAEAIGTDTAYLYSVKMKLAETGEPVTIGEVKDRLQAQDREIRELKAAKPADAPAPAVSKTQSELNELDRARTQLEANWQSFQQSEDWARMLKEDQGQALISMNQYQLASQQLTQARAAKAQQLKDEHGKLLAGMAQHIEEWSDPGVMESDRQGMKQWLAEQGVAQYRMESEMDPAVIKVWRNAWKASQAPAPKPAPAGLKPLRPKVKPKQVKQNPRQKLDRARSVYSKAKTPQDQARALNKIFGN